MNRFPRYGPPFPYYRPYNYSYSQSQIPNNQNNQNNITKNNDSTNCKINKKDDDEHNRNLKDFKDVVWLDLFGIKLYFDDVLILSLLFFLYKEEVKDEGLFLALVMLLIS